MDVFWGTEENPELLFASEFKDASQKSNETDNSDLDHSDLNNNSFVTCPWEIVVPFCQTVLQLCQKQLVLPFVRIGMQRFRLRNFDYERKMWLQQVSPLAVLDQGGNDYDDTVH